MKDEVVGLFQGGKKSNVSAGAPPKPIVSKVPICWLSHKLKNVQFRFPAMIMYTQKGVLSRMLSFIIDIIKATLAN